MIICLCKTVHVLSAQLDITLYWHDRHVNITIGHTSCIWHILIQWKLLTHFTCMQKCDLWVKLICNNTKERYDLWGERHFELWQNESFEVVKLLKTPNFFYRVYGTTKKSLRISVVFPTCHTLYYQIIYVMKNSWSGFLNLVSISWGGF